MDAVSIIEGKEVTLPASVNLTWESSKINKIESLKILATKAVARAINSSDYKTIKEVLASVCDRNLQSEIMLELLLLRLTVPVELVKHYILKQDYYRAYYAMLECNKCSMYSLPLACNLGLLETF